MVTNSEYRVLFMTESGYEYVWPISATADESVRNEQLRTIQDIYPNAKLQRRCWVDMEPEGTPSG